VHAELVQDLNHIAMTRVPAGAPRSDVEQQQQAFAKASFDAFAKAHGPLEQARVLATRVTDTELRNAIEETIRTAAPHITDDQFEALIKSRQPLELPSQPWPGIRSANEAIGARLRAAARK
jgi:hypothetical protein